MKLTKKESETLITIKNFIKTHNYSPTIREICDLRGVFSPATIYKQVKFLEFKGYISITPKERRSIKILDKK